MRHKNFSPLNTMSMNVRRETIKTGFSQTSFLDISFDMVDCIVHRKQYREKLKH